MAALATTFAPVLMEFHPGSFPEALEAIEALPWQDPAGQQLSAARAAVEMALLDATMRFFDRGPDDVVQWMGLPGFGSPGSLKQVRFGGLLAHEDSATMHSQLRRMYWRGVRHFILKVGMQGDLERLTQVASYLRRPLAGERATLTVDAEGWWSKDEAIEWLSDAGEGHIGAIEQPVARGDEEDFRILSDLFETPIFADESVLSVEDVRRLIDLKAADGVKIGLSKCGGLLPSLRIAALARRADLEVRFGGAAVETSVLSAAGLRFLQVCPSILRAEGCLGSWLLSSDVTSKGLRFGYGGRPPGLGPDGLGAEVDLTRTQPLCDRGPLVIPL